MKHFRHLLFALALLAGVATTASAQDHCDKHCDKHREGCMHSDKATKVFAETNRKGFQQPHNPQFIFTTPNDRFMLGIGASVTLRTSYDFMGAMGNIDFVPYDIPMTKNYANRQRVMMDASTSRIFLKGIINTERLGRIVAFTDVDFRGGDAFSYLPRLRSAYISMLGFTVGRDVSTFCDLGAAPETVDFQGPNAYNFRFTEMIRYEHICWDKHITFGAALETPTVNATCGEHFSPIYQRVPDGILYMQYAWGKQRTSHIRLSGVFRDMYLHNDRLGKNAAYFGWGMQLSGHIEASSWVDLYMNGVYGRGITPYINDLMGTPYDLVYDPSNPQHMQTLPMWGWQMAAQLNIMPGKFWLTGGYSEVHLERHNGALSDNQYLRGHYIFANAFYNVTRNFTLAMEYLHGGREDASNHKNSANRLSIMAKYNF